MYRSNAKLTPQITAVIILSLLVATYILFRPSSDENTTNNDDFPRDNSEMVQYFANRNNLVNVLSVVAAVPPPQPPNPRCAPPPAPPPVCQDPGLGPPLPAPRHLAVMILFSYEVDTLEIALHEMMDIVDIIFLVEATKTHKGEPKPLMWERIKYDDRFSFVNLTKVVHVVVDDVLDTEKAKDPTFWYAERFQTQVGVTRIKIWNNYNKLLGPDDLFISANVDEMMSRSALTNLKHCQIKAEVISAALWMPLGNFNRAFKSDFPVEGRVHTFGVPTIYKWGPVSEGIYTGERLQLLWDHIMGQAPRDKYVLGGVHMTDPANLITFMLKELSATETRGFIDDNFLRGLGSNFTLENLYQEQDDIYTLANKPFWLPRCDPVETVTDIVPEIPWWLDCNRDRFPYWFGEREPRLKTLYDALLNPKEYTLEKFMF